MKQIRSFLLSFLWLDSDYNLLFTHQPLFFHSFNKKMQHHVAEKTQILSFQDFLRTAPSAFYLLTTKEQSYAIFNPFIISLRLCRASPIKVPKNWPFLYI